MGKAKAFALAQNKKMTQKQRRQSGKNVLSKIVVMLTDVAANAGMIAV